MRSNVQGHPTDWLKIGVNLHLSLDNNKRNGNWNDYESTSLGTYFDGGLSYMLNPLYPARDENNKVYEKVFPGMNIKNPNYYAANVGTSYDRYSANGNVFVQLSPFKDFNIFLEGSTEVSEDLQASTDIVRGYAYFGRAFAYLHMARIFGKAYSSTASTDLCVPLIVVYDQSARPARATVAEIYAQIKSDLDSAAVKLASVAGAVRAQKPTIDAVNALYARYYIDIKDYANAEAKAKAVINSAAGYKLASSAAEFTNEWINDKGTEPIVQFYASATEGYGSHEYYLTGSGAMQKSEDHPAIYGQEDYIPTKKLVNAYDDGDLRFAQWFNNGQGEGGYASEHNGTYYNEPGSPNFYTFRKYFGNPEIYTGTPDTRQAIKPLLISEMYLIAAEAQAQSGGNDASILNALQTARGANATTLSMDNVKNEWFKETVGEGLRFSCLKRWGDGFEAREAQDGAQDAISKGEYYDLKSMAASDYHFVFPVPYYEIQTNLNLVQNPGYSVESGE